MFPPSALLLYRRPFSSAARLLGAFALLFAVLLALPPCAARAELLYGVRSGNMLVSFDSATPGTLTEIAPITGLPGSIDAIALRPATGRLYVFTTYLEFNGVDYSSSRRLYSISMTTGAATAVGGGGPVGGRLSTSYLNAIAFNPLDDTLRVLKRYTGRGSGGQMYDYTYNYSYNPNTGSQTADYGKLAYAAGDVNTGKTVNFSRMAFAYNPAGAGSVTLYGFEANRLVTISPNGAQVSTVANNASPGAGFTISAATGVAYVSNGGDLYTLNLSTGQKTLVGNFGVDMIGIAVAPVSPPVSKWTPVDVAVNRTDNTPRLLWRENTGRYDVWKTSATTGVIEKSRYCGPLTGYTCDQIVVAPNGQTTLLWKNEISKQAQLWTLSADLASLVKQTTFAYPAEYTPQNIAADANSDLRLSWRNIKNAVALWTITPSTGAITASAVYGPYKGLEDGAIAVGADGNIRLLWRNRLTGGAVVWTIPGAYGAPTAGYTYSPVAGAVATDIAVGADNKTRLLWSYPDGKIALWKLNTTVGGNGAIETGKFYGPVAGVSSLGLSVGGDNQTRQLWRYEAASGSLGKAALWTLSDPLTAITASYTYGPVY